MTLDPQNWTLVEFFEESKRLDKAGLLWPILCARCSPFNAAPLSGHLVSGYWLPAGRVRGAGPTLIWQARPQSLGARVLASLVVGKGQHLGKRVPE